MSLPPLPFDKSSLRDIGAAAFAITAENPFPDHPQDPITLCTNRLAHAITTQAVPSLPDLDNVRFASDAIVSGSMMIALSARLRRPIGQLWLAELEIFRVEHGSVWDRLAAMAQDHAAHQTMRDFFEWLSTIGFRAMFATYPLLDTVMWQVVDAWWRHCTQFLDRLNRDVAQLGVLFASDDMVVGQPLINVLFDMGDLHNGGESVSGARLTSQRAAVLKPRDGAADQLWASIIHWINAASGEPWLRAPRVLPMGAYVWSEYIAPQPCHSSADVTLFYERAGALLALCHVLGMGDLHHENVIACGAYPIVVDSETLLSPQKLANRTTADEAARSTLSHSITRLGILPHWQPVGKDGWWDSASLGTGRAPGTIQRAFVGRNLSPQNDMLPVTMTANVPRVDGVYYGADRFIDDICAGFERMRAFLSARRNQFEQFVAACVEGNPIAPRIILRHTLQYSMALEQAHRPEALRDDSIREQFLTPSLIDADSKECVECVQSAEFSALSRGDIPLFRVSCVDNRLISPTRCATLPLSGCEPGISAFRRRLAELEDDRGQYRRLIRWSFEGRTPIDPIHKRPLASSWPKTAPARTSELLQEAVRIGDLLLESSITADDGSMTWLVPYFAEDGQRYGIRPANESLYIGRNGIALFLANLGVATGKPRFQSAALSAVTQLDSRLRRDMRVKPLNCGVIGGYGSAIFAGAEIGRLLGQTSLIDATAKAVLAADWAPLFEEKAASNTLDMLGGKAGLLLALITLWQQTQSDVIRSLCCDIADMLTETTLRTKGNVVTMDGQQMTGLSHGNAGIAHALMAAHAVTNSDDYVVAATLAVAAENRYYNKDASNWQDRRQGGSQHGMVAWCNGASGIGLSRLRWADRVPGWGADVEAALVSTRRFPPGGTQHLCCGDAGRLVFLTRAAHILQRDALREATRRRATWLIERAHQHNGNYVLVFGDTQGSEANPSLFRGVAGLGWLFLEMSGPDDLSDPLLGIPRRPPKTGGKPGSFL